MLNNLVMVGRLANEPEVKELENGKKLSNITLAVPRNYKNENGEYETDFFNITLWGGIATNTSQYCHKGDIIGIKGRMKSNLNKDNQYVMEIVPDKVTFLSSKKSIEASEVNKNSIDENVTI